jgi:hypothetical protein
MIIFATQHPKLVYLIECIGKWDLELGLDVSTEESVSVVVDEIADTFRSHIRSIKIVPMFRVLKWDLYPLKKRYSSFESVYCKKS